MTEIKNQPNGSYPINTTANTTPSIVREKPSYAIGAAAGAVAGAATLQLYVAIDPFYLGTGAVLASAYISNARSLLLTGACVGALAGVIRTAVDRRWEIEKNNKNNALLDVASGFTAAPLATIGKCMVFPWASTLWQDLPFIFQATACSAVGGLTATMLAPVGIAASIAARIANERFAK